MSMSTHVIGFKPADDKWHQMKAIWDACQAADIAVPDEVERFFGGEAPDPAGVEVEERDLVRVGAVTEWSADGDDGYEIHVANLPPDVTVIRVFNSY